MIDGLGVEYVGGVCPVEAEGSIDGHRFYFYARGARWSLGIGGSDPIESADWYYEEPYGQSKSAAGFMKEEEAIALIRKAMLMFRAENEAA